MLSGAVDNTLGEYDIQIKFIEPYHITSFMEWHLDDSKKFISLTNKEQYYELIGNSWEPDEINFVFEINTEDQEDTIKIVANGIECIILNDEPF
ncbi:hypothetical protein BG261_08585 [Floricoccus tropicus]|uniref:Uncharacterized protein n=1 Tax=Floricoccus tropicus TaxID=1859473 RepID=A0A1E8GLE0_9LACT|nr:hypothetical protein [Floricoccus tropicus]OFI48328.1 hypothetical protein BG261_08585 [Floricoccus tropicus]